MVVLALGAWVLFKIVIGVIAAVAWLVVGVVAVVAVAGRCERCSRTAVAMPFLVICSSSAWPAA